MNVLQNRTGKKGLMGEQKLHIKILKRQKIKLDSTKNSENNRGEKVYLQNTYTSYITVKNNPK